MPKGRGGPYDIVFPSWGPDEARGAHGETSHRKGLADDDRDDLKVALYVWIAVVVAAMAARDVWLLINPHKDPSVNKDTEMGAVAAAGAA